MHKNFVCITFSPNLLPIWPSYILFRVIPFPPLNIRVLRVSTSQFTKKNSKSSEIHTLLQDLKQQNDKTNLGWALLYKFGLGGNVSQLNQAQLFEGRLKDEWIKAISFCLKQETQTQIERYMFCLFKGVVGIFVLVESIPLLLVSVPQFSSGELSPFSIESSFQGGNFSWDPLGMCPN